MRARCAEYLDHACQGGIGAGTHVQRFGGKPDGLDADHRSSSRNHCAHSAADDAGQARLTVMGLRRNSMRISAAGDTGAGTLGKGKNGGSADGGGAGSTWHARRRQLWTRLAFKPYARAMAATEAPGWAHWASTAAFSSALCSRREET